MSNNHHFKILVVKANTADRDAVVSLLIKLGHPIIEAGNGRDGFEKVRLDSRISAVISDRELPIMSGSEMLKHIRALKMEVPVLFLDGNPESQKESGAIDRFYTPSSLLLAVQRTILLGISFRSLNEEVSSICKAQTIAPEKRQAFEDTQREFVKVRKIAQVLKSTCTGVYIE